MDLREISTDVALLYYILTAIYILVYTMNNRKILVNEEADDYDNSKNI